MTPSRMLEEVGMTSRELIDRHNDAWSARGARSGYSGSVTILRAVGLLN